MNSSEHEQIELLDWDAIKAKFVIQLLAGVTVVGVIAFPVTIWQAAVIGRLEAHDVFILAVIFTNIFVFLFRKKTPIYILSAYVTLLAISLTLVVTYVYGVINTGFLWYFFSSFLVGLLYRLKLVIAYSLFYSIFTIFVAIAFRNGSIILALDADEFVVLPSIWATKIIVTVVGAGVMVHAIRTLQNNLRWQVQQIRTQTEHIEHLANHDPLTGLPTLRLANDRLEMALNLAKRNKRKCGVLFLDLDGFKRVNDTYGHDVGDMILESVATRILAELRESDTACRIGGDEFLIVLSEIESASAAEDVCRRIIAVIGEPFVFEDTALNVGVSIGAAFYPEHGDTAQILRTAADDAMYEVKKTGKNNFRIKY